MKPRILFLRPFWDATVTSSQLRTVHRTAKRFGTLVAICNGSEALSAAGIKDLELIVASDDSWQIEVIKQVKQAAAIILHIAPKVGPEARLGQAIENQARVQTEHGDDFKYNPIQEFGTGQGILRELAYRREGGALHKVIALMPREVLVRLKNAVSVLEQTASGQWYRRVPDGFIAATPRLSASDQVLRELKHVHSIVAYPKFGTLSFHLCIWWTLRRCLAAVEQPLISGSTPTQGRDDRPPVGPLRLPPDQELKNLRFTPPHLLTAIPRSEIVELSLDEVRKLHREVDDGELKCPRCGRGPEVMFWYQYGLTPQFFKEAGTYMRCQYCGNDEYLSCESID